MNTTAIIMSGFVLIVLIVCATVLIDNLLTRIGPVLADVLRKKGG